MVFVLMVKIELADAARLGEFLDHFKALWTYCQYHEAGTLTYDVYVNDKESNKLLIAERYVTKEDLVDVHRKSAAFVAFKAWMTDNDIIASVDGHSYTDGPIEGQLTLDKQRYCLPSAPTANERLLVFCGFNDGKLPNCLSEAENVGALAGKKGWDLVYGGGSGGMMGAVAKAAHTNGSKVTGVLPNSMSGVSGDLIGETIYVDTMAERKSIMFRMCTVVVALPGGIGTLDELLEILTLHQLNACPRRIGLLNVDGFYDPFLGMLRHLIDKGFLNASCLDYMVVCPDAATLLDKIDAFRPQATDAGFPAAMDWDTTKQY